VTLIPTALDDADALANRATWLAALRSGDYAQAGGALRVGDSYCCLGVAEDLRDRTAWLPASEHASHCGTHELAVESRYVREAISLTPATMRWLGLLSPTPHVVVRDPDASDAWDVVTLPELNDDWSWSLGEIADAVEAQGPDWRGDREGAVALRDRLTALDHDNEEDR
jgi:hypothetical protein